MSSRSTAAISPAGFQFLADEDRRVILAPGLSLSFLRGEDRWTHALAVSDGRGPFSEIARTVESDPARDAPARVVSPVYQEIEPHPIEGGVCALLTGQSTPHHFSAVVTARRDGPSTVVEFDIADRCRGPIEVLAATYLVHLGSGDLRDADARRIVWGGDGQQPGRLEFSTRAPDTVALAEAGRRATRVQVLAPIDPVSYTQRLYYCWRWTPTPL